MWEIKNLCFSDVVLSGNGDGRLTAALITDVMIFHIWDGDNPV